MAGNSIDFGDFSSPISEEAHPASSERTWRVRPWTGLGVKTGIAECGNCGFSAKGILRFIEPKGPAICEPCFAHDNPDASGAWGCVHAWVPEIGQRELQNVIRTAQVALCLKPESPQGIQASILLRCLEQRVSVLSHALRNREWNVVLPELAVETRDAIAPNVRTLVLNVDPREVASWVEGGGTFGGFRVEGRTR